MDIANEKIKVSVKFYEEVTAEKLLRTIRDIKKIVNTYDLFTELTAAEVYRNFQRVLKEDSRDTLDDMIAGETQDAADLETQISDLVTNELGIKGQKNQVKYLRKSNKSGNFQVKK